MVSTGVSFDPGPETAPPLEFDFPSGVACRSRFDCNTFAFLGGTTGSVASRFALSDDPQQFRNERNFPFLGFAVLEDTAGRPALAFSWAVKLGPVNFSCFECLLARLPLRLFSLIISFEARLDDDLSSSEIFSGAGAEVSVWACELDDERSGIPGPAPPKVCEPSFVSGAIVTSSPDAGLSSSLLMMAFASSSGIISGADVDEVGLSEGDVKVSEFIISILACFRRQGVFCTWTRRTYRIRSLGVRVGEVFLNSGGIRLILSVD